LEMQLGVNWIGHFYLQQLLQDIVEESAPSRIVIVTSKGHEALVVAKPPEVMPVRDNEESRASYQGARNYGLSKLMNVFHVQELAERMKAAGKKVEVVAVHPGAVDTDLGRYLMDILRPFVGDAGVNLAKEVSNLFILDVHSGALTQLWAATSKEITEKNLSGTYAVPIARTVSASQFAKNRVLQKRVWEDAETIIKAFPRQH
jgi:NAD(P)-dependent dehydrogenase (short-subunit alcohol dehydrogenase family)